MKLRNMIVAALAASMLAALPSCHIYKKFEMPRG